MFLVLSLLIWTASMLPARATPAVVLSRNQAPTLSRTPVEKSAPFRVKDGSSKESKICTFKRENTNYIAQCCGQNRKEVPRYLPSSITKLELCNNSIASLPDNCFSHYKGLLSLSLCGNVITKLSNLSFNGLAKLEYLDLSLNGLSYRLANFPTMVFKPLKNLIYLYLNKNNIDPRRPYLKYPDVALSELSSLRTLHMDGLRNPTFGPGFGQLQNLSTLDLRGYQSGVCKIQRLRNGIFVNLKNLTKLDLSDCYIMGKYIDKEAFLPLTHLHELVLTHNEDIGVKNLNKIFYGLQNAKNLKYLSLHLVVNRYSLGNCLEHKSLEYFPQSVERLNVRENNLEAVDRKVIQILSNVKELDISENNFVFGTYLQALPAFSNLTSISMNAGGFTYSIPKIYPYEPWLGEASPSSSVAPSTCSLYNRYNGIGRDTRLYYGKYKGLRPGTPFVLKLPPKLKKIEMNNAGLTYILSKLTVDKNNVLEQLSLPGNRFPRLEGPIEGFINLKHLNFSDCGIRYINTSFFHTFKALETLRLDSNLLSSYFKLNSSTKVFSSLTNLKMLNLSGNALTFLSPHALVGLDNLEYLYLQQNMIPAFYVKISHMHQLRAINLSGNRIKSLFDSARHSIDMLLAKGILFKFKASLASNPIACSCANVDFLEWMSKSPAFREGFRGYYCSLPDFTTRQITNGYDNIIEILRRECTTHQILFLVVATTSAVSLVIIVAAICYRFRFKLLYLYYMAYLLHKKKRRLQQTPFQYDAFICYADEDLEFVENQLEPALLDRGLRIFLHVRDFVAGEYINSNIVKAVSICRKTVVVVTKDMLRSNWCRFEVQMANLESVYTGRKVLIFLLLGTKPQRDENLEVFYNIQSNTYCVYPDVNLGEEPLRLMWDKLVRDIQD